MPAAAVAAPVWSPDTDPVHTLCHLLDCLLAAWHHADDELRDRLYATHGPLADSTCRLAPADERAIRREFDDLQTAIRAGLGEGVRERLLPAAVARLVREGDAGETAQGAVLSGVAGLDGLLNLPPDPFAHGEYAAIRAADEARAGLVLALARCGEPPPRHDWRGIADPAAALPTAFRPRDVFVLTVPPQYTPAPPAPPPVDPGSDVELHSADGPGPGRRVYYRNQSIPLNAVQYRVVSYLWTRDWVGFDELAEYVNAERPHATPTPAGFKTWVSRGNKALAPLRLPKRLRADTVNRRVYWEDVPDVTPAGESFTAETEGVTAVTPA